MQVQDDRVREYFRRRNMLIHIFSIVPVLDSSIDRTNTDSLWDGPRIWQDEVSGSSTT